jgi:hypothetical protein
MDRKKHVVKESAIQFDQFMNQVQALNFLNEREG